jgi:hypothetical protein
MYRTELELHLDSLLIPPELARPHFITPAPVVDGQALGTHGAGHTHIMHELINAHFFPKAN